MLEFPGCSPFRLVVSPPPLSSLRPSRPWREVFPSPIPGSGTRRPEYSLAKFAKVAKEALERAGQELPGAAMKENEISRIVLDTAFEVHSKNGPSESSL